jgi:hypothetical protein
MAGVSNPTIDAITNELEIDKELGLSRQAELTVVKALIHDIDELTSSNDYFEVSQLLLEKLFQIKSLRLRCFWNNLISYISGFLKAGILPLTVHAVFLASIYPILKFSMWIWPVASKDPTPFLATLCFANSLVWIGLVVLLILGFCLWDDRKINYTVMSINVESKLLSGVSEKIPYGAKLKVLEANKTGIFKKFVYVAPEFHIEKGSQTILFPSVDPAILGVTPDNRRFMIVYWDIDKDIARVVKEIEHFKKFKLNKNRGA